MTEQKPIAETETDRTVLESLVLKVIRTAEESRKELAEETPLGSATESVRESERGKRYWSKTAGRLSPTRGVVIAMISLIVHSQSALAQTGTDICGEGFGMMIYDMQFMAWQVILGGMFLIFLLGLLLRAVPLFTGSTAVGSLMMIGPIVGVIAFIFFVQFIDIALGYAGGPGVGAGCSPFV
jgi:hypothetical protein